MDDPKYIVILREWTKRGAFSADVFDVSYRWEGHARDSLDALNKAINSGEFPTTKGFWPREFKVTRAE